MKCSSKVSAMLGASYSCGVPVVCGKDASVRGRRLKWIRRIALGVLVVAAAAAVGGYMLLDALVTRAVQRGSEHAMGVPTAVERVSMRPLRARLVLDRFEAANPEGFKRERFLTIDRSVAVVEPATLWRSVVVMPRLHLDGLRLAIEHDFRGRSNYEPVLARLREVSRRVPGGQRYRIGELVLTDVSVVVDNPLPVGPREAVTLELDELRLTDVGAAEAGGEEGVLASELCGLIVRTVVEAVAGDFVGGTIRFGGSGGP